MAMYPDAWVDDGKIWCYYNVTTTESATPLGSNCGSASAMEVDGVSVTPAASYTFSSTGEHLVKFTANNWGRYYFTGSTALVRCYLPTSITYIDEQSFSGCSNLTLVNLKSLTITSLGSQCFVNCYNLEIDELYLPQLTSFGSSALSGCGKLHSITNLGSITGIGNYAFNGCNSLAAVVFPPTLTSIGSYCFPTSLKRITCLSTTPPTLGSLSFFGTPDVVYVPLSSVNTYKAASGWSSYANKILPIWENKLLNVDHLANGRWRRRLMMGMSKQSRYLPTGYTPYRWIRCSGWKTGEYIDTGILNQNGGIRIETTINTVDRSVPDSAVLVSPGNTWVHRIYFGSYANISWIPKTNKGFSTSLNNTAYGNKIFKLIVDDNGITADGVLYDTPWSSTSETLYAVNLRLLGIGDNGANLYFSKGMGETLIYVNDVLVRDYTPCTNPNNEAGMYDWVSETFFGNSGTGYFIVSND